MTDFQLRVLGQAVETVADWDIAVQFVREKQVGDELDLVALIYQGMMNGLTNPHAVEHLDTLRSALLAIGMDAERAHRLAFDGVERWMDRAEQWNRGPAND